jgi:hypothetical protein
MSGWWKSATEISAVEAEFAERLELIFGAASDAMGRVYARLKRPAGRDNLRLAGTLAGPECRYADTLRAKYSFVDRGSPSFLFAEALVPEPCFWTPQMPHFYQADVELLDGDRAVARASRIFGIRRLGAAGRTLMFEGKSWVLRGMMADELPRTDLAGWHEADAAMVVRNPNDAVCDAASRVGVLLVAELGTNEVPQIVRLRRWPAVGIVVVTGPADHDLRGEGHNAILAQRLPAGGPAPAPWAQAALVEAGAGFENLQVPRIALRPAGQLETVEEGRRRCDLLQRDLAQLGQFAGYIV